MAFCSNSINNANNPVHYSVKSCYVIVHSVHSNVAKIHSRLPAAMEFWLVCLGIVVCEQVTLHQISLSCVKLLQI